MDTTSSALAGRSTQPEASAPCPLSPPLRRSLLPCFPTMASLAREATQSVLPAKLEKCQIKMC